MRALLSKCLAISAVLILVETINAQELSDLLSEDFARANHILTAQFEDVMEAVPSAAAEATLSGDMSNSSAMAGMGDPVMQPENET